MDQPLPISRHRFHRLAGSSLGLTVTSASARGLEPEPAQRGAMLPTPRTIKCLNCDLNWVRDGEKTRPATAADWANLDPQEYFDYHRRFGNNLFFFQAYNAAGFAYYPTMLGNVAPGRGVQLLPRLWDLSRQAKLPFMAYMCVNYETGPESVAHRHPGWLIPGTTMFAPESGWTQLLCQRFASSSASFPSNGSLSTGSTTAVWEANIPSSQPLMSRRRLREIIGRAMPARQEEITPEEHLRYKREIMARQFRNPQGRQGDQPGHPDWLQCAVLESG